MLEFTGRASSSCLELGGPFRLAWSEMLVVRAVKWELA